MTQAEQHTIGPWYYDGEDMDSEAAASWGGNGYEIFTRDVTGSVDIPIAGDVLDEANARLIAAAPDLLEVAEDLESWNAQSTAATAAEILAELGPILVKARAAITKARTA